MFRTFRLLLTTVFRAFRSRRNLLLENLVLRQQLAALKRKHPQPHLAALDKLLWILIRRLWSNWKEALIIVNPETVVAWHRAGFKLYWRAISKARRVVGRRHISQEARDLIFRMSSKTGHGARRVFTGNS